MAAPGSQPQTSMKTWAEECQKWQPPATCNKAVAPVPVVGGDLALWDPFRADRKGWLLSRSGHKPPTEHMKEGDVLQNGSSVPPRRAKPWPLAKGMRLQMWAPHGLRQQVSCQGHRQDVLCSVTGVFTHEHCRKMPHCLLCFLLENSREPWSSL